MTKHCLPCTQRHRAGIRLACQGLSWEKAQRIALRKQLLEMTRSSEVSMTVGTTVSLSLECQMCDRCLLVSSDVTSSFNFFVPAPHVVLKARLHSTMLVQMSNTYAGSVSPCSKRSALLAGPSLCNSSSASSKSKNTTTSSPPAIPMLLC